MLNKNAEFHFLNQNIDSKFAPSNTVLKKSFQGFAKANNAKDFVYCSDEMYLRANLPLPGYDYYGDFEQIENGVGMLRLLEAEFEAALRIVLRLACNPAARSACADA